MNCQIRSALILIWYDKQATEAHVDVPDDMDSDEELPNVVFVPGAMSISPPISPDVLEDPVSKLIYFPHINLTRIVEFSVFRAFPTPYPNQRVDICQAL